MSAVSLAWLGAFLANLPFLTTTVDGVQTVATWRAVAVNLGLLLFFGLQHSLMPRPFLKKPLEAAMGPAAARGVYNVASGLVLMVLVYYWQPIEGTVWAVEGPLAWAFLLVFAAGAAMAGAAVLVIGGGELLGLPQAMAALKGEEPFRDSFRTPWLYRIVRHPMQLGVILMLFGSPQMTVGHLLFSAGMAVYVWIGVTFEEEGLTDAFGDAYVAYKKEVPKLFPWPRP
ncbi:MAG: isoprenylcysteine carboxylmethyltransferase family protein [Alphaproteobacteria bacterium]|nr:isoprenylcysteine carboxylmethyltransferase family protein [Alphaproteobacteria bacterium]